MIARHYVDVVWPRQRAENVPERPQKPIINDFEETCHGLLDLVAIPVGNLKGLAQWSQRRLRASR